MTECERLLFNGCFPPSFLEEETRCEYLVNSKMKKVWAIEMNLLQRFGQLCEKYSLRYWVAFGSLLGAVRHKGFIPWDDDMDVWMPRDDYNRLLSISNLNLEEPYFLQTTLNDVDYYHEFARFRNSNTTGVMVSANNKCNNGIYIDIIPLDGMCSEKKKEQRRVKSIKIKNVLAHAYAFNINPHLLTRMAAKILHCPLVPYNAKSVFMKLNKQASSVKWEDADKVGVTVYEPYKLEKNTFDKSDFADTIMLEFENMMVPAPIGYQKVLKVIYGDYMKFPPVEKRGLWHSFTFEPDVPYKEFLK